ncbi:MAG: hypothetical protein INR66_27210, partial [Gordonia polyisoprenivorans]|nr:hypothetical protein [Gordonia polyisoprenivorans]
LELPRFPFWDERLVAEVLSWTLLDQELTTAYVDWLAKLHRRTVASGREWTRAEFLRQSRLHEVGE